MGLIYINSFVIYYCGGREAAFDREKAFQEQVRGCPKPVSPTTTLLSDTSDLLPLHLLLEAKKSTFTPLLSSPWGDHRRGK